MIVYRSIDSSCNQNYLASRFINDSLRNVYLPRALERFISQVEPHHAKTIETEIQAKKKYVMSKCVTRDFVARRSQTYNLSMHDLCYKSAVIKEQLSMYPIEKHPK